MANRRTGVYCIRNIVNGKRYVGSSARAFSDRWGLHRRSLNNGTHHSILLQRAWAKYGEEAFVFAVVEECLPEHAVAVEQVMIDYYDATNPQRGYNICPTAGSCRGMKASESTREKVSKALRERRRSPETFAKISAALRGRKRTKEHTENQAATLRGRKRSAEATAKASATRRGGTCTPESVLARRKSRLLNGKPTVTSGTGVKGVWWYPKYGKYASCITVDRQRHFLGYFDTVGEARAAYDAARAENSARLETGGTELWVPKSNGHTRSDGVSEETRAKISVAKKGKKCSPEQRAAMSVARRGKKRKPMTPEHRAKCSAAKRGKKQQRHVIEAMQRGKREAKARRAASHTALFTLEES